MFAVAFSECRAKVMMEQENFTANAVGLSLIILTVQSLHKKLD